jgi:hypothetical protein
MSELKSRVCSGYHIPTESSRGSIHRAWRRGFLPPPLSPCSSPSRPPSLSTPHPEHTRPSPLPYPPPSGRMYGLCRKKRSVTKTNKLCSLCKSIVLEICAGPYSNWSKLGCSMNFKDFSCLLIVSYLLTIFLVH